MALIRLYCSGCGLEIYPDQSFIPHRYNDLYHDKPYDCYPYSGGEDDEQ